MFKLFKRTSHKRTFDRATLRKNDISLLILDERWNLLFDSFEKPSEIISLEEKLKDLLKEQSRLIAEPKELASHKKSCLDKIMKLTTEVFDNNNVEAINEMQACEKEIKRINDRMDKIKEELEIMPERLREANLDLLEAMVNVVYFKIRTNQKRVKELETLIEDARAKLMGYIDEKESLSQDDTDTYTYFHDLLGGEELEKLDKEFFGEADL